MDNKKSMKAFLMEVGPLRLALVGVCGLFLVLTSLPDQNDQKKTATKNEQTTEQTSEDRNDNDVYTKKMEAKLKETLEKVHGVGKAEVMITLSASRETVLNKDTPYEENSEEQEGSEKKSVKSVSSQEETVLYEENGNQVPYVVKEYEPQIEGVIAVIEGGDNSLVVSQVTEAIQALFHVEAHKIKVLKMEDES